MNNKSASKSIYNALKDDPRAVIDWCEEEIRAYMELIKLIKENEAGKKSIH